MLASDREAVVFSPRRFIFSGCLKAIGSTHVLLDTTKVGYFDALIAVRLAGRFAALEPEYDSPQDITENDTVYDLSNGKAADLAKVSWEWNGGPIVYGLDFLALDSSGFAAWRATTRPTPEPITAVSCPSASLCVAGDGAGNILSSTNPTGGPIAWSIAGVLSHEPISGVFCPSVSLCIAVGGKDVLTAADPSAGSAWTKTTPDLGSYFYAVSCPSVSLCVVGGGGASIHGGPTILTSTDPTGGASSWSGAPVASGNEIVDAVSCPSVSLCVATTNVGDVFTSTNPAGGASTWKKTTVDQGAFLDAVSCPSVSMCVASDSYVAGDSNVANKILTTTNPTGGASAWTNATIDQGYTLNAVSCASVSLCVAGDSGGKIITSTDPTGGASAWTKARVARPDPNGNSIAGVSCPSVSLCIAADLGNILTSTDPTGGANTWTSAAVDVPGCAPPLSPCISEQLYARDDQGTRVLDTAPPGHGNSIGNVALNSLVLNWTHHGAQRQLQLR